MTSVSPHYRRESATQRWCGVRSTLDRLLPLTVDLALAVLGAAASVAARLALAPLVDYRQPFLTAYPVLLLLALFRSTTSAVFFACSAVVLHTYIFIPAQYSFRVNTNADAVVIVAFMMVVTMIVSISHSQRAGRLRLVHESQERRRADEAVRKLNRELEERVGAAPGPRGNRPAGPNPGGGTP